MIQDSGAGPLGSQVSFNEFTPALQLSTPQVIASGEGTTLITGDGTAQNLFNDTFTALADGDLVTGTIHIHSSLTLGADTPDFVFKLGATAIKTISGMNLGANNSHWIRFTYSKNATAERGYGIVEEVAHAATGTAALSIAKNDATFSTAIDSVSVTADPAIGTNLSCRFSYHLVKHATGV